VGTDISRAIIEDEKVVIRSGLIHALTLHLPHPWIATDAYTIGRIARYDFPRFWPDLVTQLLDTVRQAFQLEAQSQEQWRMENALTGLASVIKELSSVKLGPAVSAFHQVPLPPHHHYTILLSPIIHWRLPRIVGMWLTVGNT
jgi:hypothetical protein